MMNKRSRHENLPQTKVSSSFFKKNKKTFELEVLAHNFEELSSLWTNLFLTFASQYAEHGKNGTEIIYSKLKPIYDEILKCFENFDNRHPDALLLIEKFIADNSVPKNMLSNIKKIKYICQSINVLELNQFISENMKIFHPYFLKQTFEYIAQFYKNNSQILFEFNRIQKAAKDFLSSFNYNQNNDNKNTIVKSLQRLRTDFLSFKIQLASQLESQETELKSKTNQLKNQKKDGYPLLNYIYDELSERLNFLTESLNLIREYDQELKKLILNLDSNVRFSDPSEIQQSNYSLLSLFSE